MPTCGHEGREAVGLHCIVRIQINNLEDALQVWESHCYSSTRLSDSGQWVESLETLIEWTNLGW